MASVNIGENSPASEREDSVGEYPKDGTAYRDSPFTPFRGSENGVSATPADSALLAWSSPAFVKQARFSSDLRLGVSFGLVPSNYELLDETRNKRRKFGRKSGEWSYAERSPSPEKDSSELETPESPSKGEAETENMPTQDLTDSAGDIAESIAAEERRRSMMETATVVPVDEQTVTVVSPPLSVQSQTPEADVSLDDGSKALDIPEDLVEKEQARDAIQEGDQLLSVFAHTDAPAAPSDEADSSHDREVHLESDEGKAEIVVLPSAPAQEFSRASPSIDPRLFGSEDLQMARDLDEDHESSPMSVGKETQEPSDGLEVDTESRAQMIDDIKDIRENYEERITVLGPEEQGEQAQEDSMKPTLQMEKAESPVSIGSRDDEVLEQDIPQRTRIESESSLPEQQQSETESRIAGDEDQSSSVEGLEGGDEVDVDDEESDEAISEGAPVEVVDLESDEEQEYESEPESESDTGRSHQAQQDNIEKRLGVEVGEEFLAEQDHSEEYVKRFTNQDSEVHSEVKSEAGSSLGQSDVEEATAEDIEKLENFTEVQLPSSSIPQHFNNRIQGNGRSYTAQQLPTPGSSQQPRQIENLLDRNLLTDRGLPLQDTVQEPVEIPHTEQSQIQPHLPEDMVEVNEQASADLAAVKKSQKRHSRVSDIMRPWFAPRKSSFEEKDEGHDRDPRDLKGLQIKKDQEGDSVQGDLGTNSVHEAIITRNKVITTTTKNVDLDTVIDPQLLTSQRNLEAHGLQTSHAYFTPLSRLPENFSNLVDIIAVAASAAPIERAKSGPKDYYLTIQIVDESLADEHTIAQIFRPFRTALPTVKPGDVVLLRDFKVQTQEHKPMLLSTESAAWVVFRQTGDARMTGPPVEYGEQEERYIEELRGWWRGRIEDHEKYAGINGKAVGTQTSLKE